MNKADIEVYKEIQRNAEMTMKAIDTVQDKVYDDDLALQLSKQNMKYTELRNKSIDKLLTGKADPYHGNAIQDVKLVSGIHMSTMLNTSTSHLAEIMIQENNRGLTHMWKSLNQHGNSSKEAMEIANELVNFQESNIRSLKRYL
ncbi:MAG TPA: hypothetical protein VJZ04_05820 [Lachnospiraceae bacterium]|nr:hypothetical protein [Lachnospiraceae bacterium]